MQRNATTTGSANSAEAGDGTALFDSNHYSRTLREFYIFLYPYIMLWPQSACSTLVDRQLYLLCIPKIQLWPVTALPRHEVVKICTPVCLRLREKSSPHLAARISYERMSESLGTQFQKTVFFYLYKNWYFLDFRSSFLLSMQPHNELSQVAKCPNLFRGSHQCWEGNQTLMHFRILWTCLYCISNIVCEMCARVSPTIASPGNFDARAQVIRAPVHSKHKGKTTPKHWGSPCSLLLL